LTGPNTPQDNSFATALQVEGYKLLSVQFCC
jgi:hypothetical protein